MDHKDMANRARTRAGLQRWVSWSFGIELSEVLRPSSSRAGQFDIELSTRSHGFSLTHQPQNGRKLEGAISRVKWKIPVGPRWDLLSTLLAECFEILEGGWP